MSRTVLICAVLAGVLTPSEAAIARPVPADGAVVGRPAAPSVQWRSSRAVGAPNDGRLVRGVLLPASGEDFTTWDSALRRLPSRPWRRHGTATLIRLILDVAAEHRAAHPLAPRLVIGDLSRPRGGAFGARFGGLGHASHQNGLDVDIFYPRRDGLERRPRTRAQVDAGLAQDLIDRFVAAGAQRIFVGFGRFSGPRRVVVPLAHHEDHLHVRIAPGDAR